MMESDMHGNFSEKEAVGQESTVPAFETLGDALSEENREELAFLSEQIDDIARSHGGRIDDAELSSAERLIVDRHDELKAKALGNIRMAG